MYTPDRELNPTYNDPKYIDCEECNDKGYVLIWNSEDDGYEEECCSTCKGKKEMEVEND